MRAKLLLLAKHPLIYLSIAAFAQNAWAHRANTWAHRANAYILLYLKSITDPTGKKTLQNLPSQPDPPRRVWPADTHQRGHQRPRRLERLALAHLHSLRASSYVGVWHPDGLAQQPPFHHVRILPNLRNQRWRVCADGLAGAAAAGGAQGSRHRHRAGHATIPLGAWRAVDALHYAIGCPLALGLDAGGVGVVLAMRFWFVARWPDFARRGYGRAEGEGEESSPGDACDGGGRGGCEG